MKERYAKIVEAMVKRFAMERSRLNIDEVIELAEEDRKSEIFIYDVVLTDRVYKQRYISNLAGGNGHWEMGRKIFDSISDKNDIRDVGEFLDRSVRGYWIPKKKVLYLHQINIPRLADRFNMEYPNSSMVSRVLSEIHAKPEQIFVMGN